jgi:L-seryl-tRNA(Ser) seleniumtransferase
MVKHLTMQNLLRKIPKVDDILRDEAWRRIENLPEALAKESLRDVLNELRAAIRDGERDTVPGIDQIIDETERRSLEITKPGLKKVINGTGVILHTNLGRSALAAVAVDRLVQIAAGYSNLEYDLAKGKRGDRYEHCVSILKRLTGVESALVVNNNAAAVLLAVNTLAEGKEVIISRGELIEIGGSFRIPEVMKKSGAILKEVGTTNRTFIEDYEAAVTAQTGLIMKAHSSNYRIRGFVHETTSEELASLAEKQNIPFFFDIGSGLFSALEGNRYLSEPSILEEAKKNVDVISFSGDKLLGGPQAGIIIGKAVFLDEMKKNPLTRALRPDKFTLSTLEATLLLYLDPENARREIPILRMLHDDVELLKKRAGRIAKLLLSSIAKAGKDPGNVEGEAQRPAGQTQNGSRGTRTPVINVLKLESEMGGGSLPDTLIPSFGIAVQPSGMTVAGLEQKLRSLPVPVIGRIERDCFIVDMRTVQEEDEPLLISALTTALDGR